ncbi:MAG: type II toxin-antitoxin system VapC family toxin [Bryobacterales bacterium]|nr:type II toxin-antitoxin system VapC family toxin [Bryobacterales bacterium]
MTLRYLLDTSVVSVPVWKEPDARLLHRLNAAGPECAIASPVWHELTYGCSRLAKGKRRSALETYLRDVVRGSFPTLPYDEAAAAWHGAERARLEANGRPTPFVDGQIAAIAQVNGLILVTANERDFAAFSDLNLENWSTHSRRRPKS